MAALLSLEDVSLPDWLSLAQTAVAAVVVMALALAATATRRVDRVTSRKMLHMFMGSTYVLHFLLYSSAPYTRYLCALVPALATGAFLLVGLGAVPFDLLVRSATRGGKRQELLTGPLVYGAVHAVLTIVFWRDSPSGVIAIAVLCFGDGAAELVGRRAHTRLWHNRRKTWAGSAACLVAGAGGAMALAFAFRTTGAYVQPVPAPELAASCLLAAAVGAVVESLPLEPDNLTVPLAAAVASVWWLGF